MLSTLYDTKVTSGQIKDDAAQREILSALQDLAQQLTRPAPVAASALSRWFGKKSAISTRGLYIWGNVGRGKSMLMDLFFQYAPVARKRRIHFHAFMQEVHARMHQLRQEGRDPVVVLAQQIAAETTLLCFDELQASDVADATLLYRLFQGLFDGGVTIVSTSNHPPVSLYTGSIQRERFAKFIALIESHMRVMPLSSPADYRHMQIKGLQQVYFQPLGPAADAFTAEVLERLCPGCAPRKDTLAVQGRLTPFLLYNNEIGRFTFHELCENALGPGDYLAIAKRLDTIILTGIPKLPAEKRNEAKRFVTLIDALYENKVKLICTAAVPPEEIYSDGDGAFEFKRTVSRLAEMQSAQYLHES